MILELCPDPLGRLLLGLAALGFGASLLFVCLQFAFLKPWGLGEYLRMWVLIKSDQDERVVLWEFCALVPTNSPQIDG